MTELHHAYMPHLTIKESSLPPGIEWTPKPSGWALIQVAAGAGYWMGSQLNQELETGAVLLLSARARGNIRASQLGGLRLHFFCVDPERLTALLTSSEQRSFNAAAAKDECSQRIFQPQSPLAENLKELCADQTGGVPFRLRLLQLFIGVFSDELKEHPPAPKTPRNARERLEELLRQTPTSELLYMSFAQLAQMTRCTPRHLNRIFTEVVGMSFRDKHTELRLARACELLATTESKVVDVALESGYQSLSLFNLMFARRFGLSPGKWRQTQRGITANAPRRGTQKMPVWNPGNPSTALANFGTKPRMSQGLCA